MPQTKLNSARATEEALAREIAAQESALAGVASLTLADLVGAATLAATEDAFLSVLHANGIDRSDPYTVFDQLRERCPVCRCVLSWDGVCGIVSCCWGMVLWKCFVMFRDGVCGIVCAFVGLFRAVVGWRW